MLPPGVTFSLSTDRPKGLLQLVVGRRVYPFIRLTADGNGFRLQGPPPFGALPGWVTSDVLSAINNEATDLEGIRMDDIDEDL